MSRKQDAPRMSSLRGFLFGIGTTVLIAIIVLAVRHEGVTKSTAPPPAEPATATPGAIVTIPLADHVAAVSGSQDQPAAAAAAAPSTSPAQAPLLSGTIELDKPIAHSVTGTVTVFVIARDRNGKGHPVLAKRLNVASFPTMFSLGPEDAMMGQTPPDHVLLEARIDLDGDAMTREPGVPEAKIESVAIGSRHVTLTLKRGV